MIISHRSDALRSHATKAWPERKIPSGRFFVYDYLHWGIHVTMSKGQESKRIGQGMKPRGNAGVSQPKPIAAPIVAPTGVGQPESLIAPVLERVELEQKGGTLEPENSAKPQPKNAVGVAPSPEEEDQLSALADALIASGFTEPAEAEDANEGVHPAIEGGIPAGPTPVGVQEIPGVIMYRGENPLGPQPNGSHGIVLNIGEGYWEAVQQWAEADGVAAEEWCNMRFTEYLETWSSPAKGR